MTLDVSAVPSKPVGAGRYTFELARELSLRDDMRPICIARRSDELRWEALRGNARVTAVAPEKRPLRLAWEQLRLPAVLQSIGPHVHHGPHYTLPQRSRIPKVVTIHDMTFFDHPEWHEKSKVIFFRRSIEASVKRAQELIAVSNDTAGRLQDRFGIANVTVIPHGVDHRRFRPAASSADMQADRVVLESAGITGAFVAFVGTLEPRKDVPSLVRAFDRIAGSHPQLRLVLVGRPGWGVGAVTDAIGSARHKDRIVRPGFISDRAIPALLRQARAVVYPSLTEGFGLPALEALACGAPLVTTTGSAIEEVVDDAALLVDAGDVAAIAQSLEKALTDEEERTRLRRRGPQVAAAFTWSGCAADHVEVYRRAAMES